MEYNQESIWRFVFEFARVPTPAEVLAIVVGLVALRVLQYAGRFALEKWEGAKAWRKIQLRWSFRFEFTHSSKKD